MTHARARRVWLAAAAAAVLLLITAALASGSTSGLIEGNCAQDATDGPNPNVCGTITPGLSGARAADISSDGESVYLASFGDEAIHFFDRDPSDGDLDAQGTTGCIGDNDTASDSCITETNGLGGVRDVAVAPDGESVYATSVTDDAIVHLDRDAANPGLGSLTPVDCVDDNDTATDANQGPDACGTSTDGMNGAFDVAVSPDNKSVYVTSRDDDAIVIFNRDISGTATHGNLTPAGCIDTAPPPTAFVSEDSCAHNVSVLLSSLQGIVVSPDNRSVYVSSFAGDLVAAFVRDTTTGALTFQSCVKDRDAGIPFCDPSIAFRADGLAGPRGLAISADGAHVYAAGSNDDAILRLVRDTSNTATHGTLTDGGCVDDADEVAGQGPDPCPQTAEGLNDVRTVETSPDGLSVYSGSAGDAALGMFDRDPANGALSVHGCIADNMSAENCEQSSELVGNVGDVAISSDGDWLYAPSQTESTLTTFERDSVPPNTFITGGPTGSTEDSSPTFTFAGAGGFAGFECRVDGGPFAPCSGPNSHTTGALALGAHTFEVRARDAAFNRDPTPAQQAFTVVAPQPPPPGDGGSTDASPPDTQITQQPKDKSKKKTATFAFGSSEPGSTFTCVLDGKQEFKACTSPLTVKVKKGKHTFSVTATDASGNPDPSPATDAWKVKKKKRKK